jgi:hypothetical protein
MTSARQKTLQPDEGGSSDLHNEPGPIEQKAQSDLDALHSEHPMAATLAAMTLNLARTLDAGAGLAVAAVNRELRANLEALARMGADDDDLDAELRAAVQHPAPI